MMSCRQLPQLPQLSKLTKLLQFLKFVPGEDHSFPSFEESFPSTSNGNFLKTVGGIDQTSDFQTVLIRVSRKGFHQMHRARSSRELTFKISDQIVKETKFGTLF
jgi:hypothetical protein